MPTTRSKAKKDSGDIPQKPPPPPPKPSKRNSKVGPSQAPKDLETARNDGANLLQTLLEKQKQELDDALGTEDRGSSGRSRSRGRVHSRGRGRGRGLGCGRGRGRGHGRGGGQNGQVIAVDDITAAETAGVESDDPDGNVGHPFIQLLRIYPRISG